MRRSACTGSSPCAANTDVFPNAGGAIPRLRSQAVGDVTGLYEQHEVEAFLAEDAVKHEAFVRAGERETLKLETQKA